MKNFFRKLSDQVNILYEGRRFKIQLVIVSVVFFIVGGVFTIINFKNPSTYTLGIVTATFCGLSLLTCLFTIFLKKGHGFVEFLFVISALIMFIYFLVFGGAGLHGFSTYWILLLPFIAMMVLGLLKGSITTLAMFLIIAFFLWIPYGRTLIQWTMEDVFIVRFPLVYLAAFAASFLFEYSRHVSDRVALELNQKLELAATHDFLTGLTNRLGLANIIKEQSKLIGSDKFAVAGAMLIDVDNFKRANDVYGHAFGDEVLIAISNVLKKYAGENAIRFGGDEFICLFQNKPDFELREIAEEIRQEIEDIKFPNHPEYSVTVCVGIAYSKVDKNYRVERVIELADYQSSRAKRAGKNMVYLISYDEVMSAGKKGSKNLYDMFGEKEQ